LPEGPPPEAAAQASDSAKTETLAEKPESADQE